MENDRARDHDLILACRAGDGGAWEQVLQRYERLVFSIPLNYGLSSDDAADITQITFTILMQQLHTLRDDSYLGAWLATVARRQTWRALQRTRREATDAFEDVSEHVAVLGMQANNPVERWELVEWLQNGLQEMDDRCRDLLIALYFDTQQPSYADIAAQLGMPIGSIGPTRARCLERLKRVLGEP